MKLNFPLEKHFTASSQLPTGVKSVEGDLLSFFLSLPFLKLYPQQGWCNKAFPTWPGIGRQALEGSRIPQSLAASALPPPMLVSPRQFWGFASPVNTCCSASPADGWFSAGPARWLTSLEGGPEPDVGCLGATGTAVLPPRPDQVLCVGCRLQDPLSHFHSLVTWQLLVSPLSQPRKVG